MRRVLLGLLLVVAALVALPPLVFAVVPVERYELPPPGRKVPVGDGVSVNALERGAGPPVVLVHGLPGSGYDWEPLSQALAERGHRAIAYDRVGYGHSDARPDGDYTVEANARELLALLEREGLEDATVAGWSYGGPVAIRAAALDSSRIARLVLIGSGGPSDERREEPVLLSLLFSRPVLAWLSAVPPAARGLRRAMSAEAFGEEAQPDWWMPRLHANLDRPATLDAWRGEGAHFREEPLPIEAVERPFLLVHGEADRLVPVAVARWLHRHAERSELAVVEGGSHMLPITRPASLADRIAAFARAR